MGLFSKSKKKGTEEKATKATSSSSTKGSAVTRVGIAVTELMSLWSYVSGTHFPLLHRV
jgi:hypothetical protein